VNLLCLLPLCVPRIREKLLDKKRRLGRNQTFGVIGFDDPEDVGGCSQLQVLEQGPIPLELKRPSFVPPGVSES